jgi:hypothetical protein
MVILFVWSLRREQFLPAARSVRRVRSVRQAFPQCAESCISPRFHFVAATRFAPQFVTQSGQPRAGVMLAVGCKEQAQGSILFHGKAAVLPVIID